VNRLRSRLAAVLLVGLAACNNDPTRASFSQNVGAAFAQCNPAEIRFLATKHNFMPAFEPCGSNNFDAYAWSPDGTHLYFQLTHAGHVMNAEAQNKATITVPTETPIGPAAWLTSTRLAVPIGPPEGGKDLRLALYDLPTGDGQTQIRYETLPGLTKPQDLHVGDKPTELLFTAERDGKRQIWRMNLDDGTIAPAWAWAAPLEVDTFDYQPARNALTIGAAGKVTLYDTDGKAQGEWMPARRGTLHPGGRWLALEYDGQAISIFYQRTWDELSEKARARELARAKEFEERLPPWYPREVKPPTISLVDLQTGKRWVFTGFHGTDFQWYEARDYYASFILWGFEGKQMNRNILLGDLADRMHSMERGEEMLGVQKWNPDDTEAPDGTTGPSTDATPAPGSEAEPEAAPADPPNATLPKPADPR
jgi:WD40-like Beta Propeller Repeat